MEYDSLVKRIEREGEYPIFVRGTCVEEAAWLLDCGRDTFRSHPKEIYAFPVIEGFERAGIEPMKPIPANYNLRKMRDEVLIVGEVNHARNSSLFNYGDTNTQRESYSDYTGMGVVIYFSPEIIDAVGYEQDRDVEDRLEQLCAVKISIDGNFDPNLVSFVEPIGIGDLRVLRSYTDSRKVLPARFAKEGSKHDYVRENLDDITFGKDGFTFPE